MSADDKSLRLPKFYTLWDIKRCLPKYQPYQDDIVPPQVVYNWIEKLSTKPTLIRLAHADHFFHGKLVELRTELQSQIKIK